MLVHLGKRVMDTNSVQVRSPGSGPPAGRRRLTGQAHFKILKHHLNNPVKNNNEAHSQIDTLGDTLAAGVLDPLARDLMVMRSMGTPWTTKEK